MSKTICLKQQIEEERAHLNRLIDVSLQKNGRIVVDKKMIKSTKILDRLSVKLFKKNS